VKPKDQRIAEMAGAVTRLVINDALREAKARAKIRDSNTHAPEVKINPKNG
jgi:hypothetical protein